MTCQIPGVLPSKWFHTFVFLFNRIMIIQKEGIISHNLHAKKITNFSDWNVYFCVEHPFDLIIEKNLVTFQETQKQRGHWVKFSSGV